MSHFALEALNDLDFEELIRDLLNAERGWSLKSFPHGRDGGIDLREKTNGDLRIVQCKHYIKSSFSDLLREARQAASKELQPVPTEYVFATSMSLSPQQEDKIQEVFTNWPLPVGVVSRSDVEMLLSRSPHVLELHFKLWLISSGLLSRLLHAKVFAQTDLSLEEMQNKVRLLVATDHCKTASEKLSENRVVILAGNAGVGKSTIAQILISRMIGDGYEPIIANESIYELMEIESKGRKQIFLFDDFLGQLHFEERARRNEHRSLTQFISHISQSKDKLLILATREHILQQAYDTWEMHAKTVIERHKFVLHVTKLSESDKARILYNHLVCANLPKPVLAKFLEQKTYRQVVRHRNYNPRIIEAMTVRALEADLNEADYCQAFTAALDDPSSIYQVAIWKQISDPARWLLATLATMPLPVRVDRLEKAWAAVLPVAGLQIGSTRFLAVLKEVEGAFVSVDPNEGDPIVQFYNPSLRECTEQLLLSEKSILGSLVQSACFFNQIIRLVQALNQFNAEWMETDPELSTVVKNKIRELKDSPSTSLQRTLYNGRLSRFQESRFFHSSRVLSILEISETLDDSDITGIAFSYLVEILKADGSWLDYSLLECASSIFDRIPEVFDELTVSFLVECIQDNLGDTLESDDVLESWTLLSTSPLGCVLKGSGLEIGEVARQWAYAVADWASRTTPVSADDYERLIAGVRMVFEELGEDVDEAIIDELEEAMHEASKREYEPFEGSNPRIHSTPSSFNVDELFDRLR